MAAVYILYSASLDRFYRGSCRNLEERLRQHREKVFPESFTAKADDWVLFWSMDGLPYAGARALENHLKKMRNRQYYQNLKRYPELVAKLRAKFSD